MRIALDPYMHRHLSLDELPRKAAELGYEWIELSPRADFLDWWVAPAGLSGARAKLQEGPQRSRREDRVAVADVPLGEPARGRAASRCRILEEGHSGAVDMGVDTMNSEFGRGPSPARGHSANCCGGRFTAETSEAAWWRSMEELVPIFEREGVQLNIEPILKTGSRRCIPRSTWSASSARRKSVPLLRAAYVLFRRGHGQDDPRVRRHARACPCRGHLQPQGLFGLRISAIRPALR